MCEMAITYGCNAGAANWKKLIIFANVRHFYRNWIKCRSPIVWEGFLTSIAVLKEEFVTAPCFIIIPALVKVSHIYNSGVNSLICFNFRVSVIFPKGINKEKSEKNPPFFWRTTLSCSKTWYLHIFSQHRNHLQNFPSFLSWFRLSNSATFATLSDWNFIYFVMKTFFFTWKMNKHCLDLPDFDKHKFNWWLVITP